MVEMYKSAIEEATAILLSAMLENDVPVRESRRALDRSVFRLLTVMGRKLLETLYEEMGERMTTEMAPELKVERQRVAVFTTLFGTVSVRSPYLRNRQTKESARPLKDMFGLTGGACSDAVERAMTDFGSDRSFSRAALSMQEHYGLDVDRCAVLRRTLELGERAVEYVDARLSEAEASYMQPKVERQPAGVLVAELDGCHLPVGEFKTAGEAGRTDLEPDKVVRIDAWLEARTGFVRGLDEVDKTYVCQNAKYPVICQQLYGAACLRGLGPDTRVIAPGDGGNGLREGLEVVFPNLEFRLDPTHLKDNFFKCAEALGIEQPARTAWVREHLDLVWDGRLTEAVGRVEKLREAHKRPETIERYHAVRRLLKYLEDHTDCLDFPRYKEEGTPFGSGEVESSHKSVPQERLKIPGAKWRRDHINPMLALRVIRANGWWGDFWECEQQRKAAA